MNSKAKFHYAICFEAGSKLVADRLEAKLHYAIWWQAGSKLVRSWSQTGADQLWTCLRPASSRFELSRHVEIARTCSNLVADRLEARFHYAIWSQTGSKLVRRWSQTCSELKFGLSS